MQHNVTWTADTRSTVQELPCLLLKFNVQYRIYRSPPVLFVLNHMNQIQAFVHYVFNSHFNIILPSINKSSKQFPPPIACSAKILYAFLFPHGTLHVSVWLIVFHLISVRIFCAYIFEASPHADGRDSIVDLATCYGLDSSEFESW